MLDKTFDHIELFQLQILNLTKFLILYDIESNDQIKDISIYQNKSLK